MAETRDWNGMIEMSARLLVERTGEDVAAWNDRIQKMSFPDEKNLRDWLSQQGVSGYAQTLLVMERFGYPNFFLASAGELIDGQYADRLQLRPIFDALMDAVAGLDQVTIQARKTYVSLVTPRRTFARVQAAKERIDVGLRLEGQAPTGRLGPSKIHETMRVQISLATLADLDGEALHWLQLAFDENI